MSDGFLARWARRKREVRVAEADPAAGQAHLPPRGEGEARSTLEIDQEDRRRADDPALLPAPTVAPGEAEPDLLAQLPSLEDLTAQTDLTPFLRAGVPAALRKAALRKMWSVDPAIRDFVSEARDYAYDWNTPGGVPGTGPLLPGDDVKAMLQRLFNRDPSEADPVTVEANRSEPDPDPETAPAATLEPPDHTSEPMPLADPAISPEPKLVTASSSVAIPRLRRHGGAMPS